MAVCPKCEWNVNTAHVVKGEMACPHCRTPLCFNRRDYGRAVMPGLYVAAAILLNMLFTVDHVLRGVISFLLLTAWLVFFRGYKRFLRSATLEINERRDLGQDI